MNFKYHFESVIVTAFNSVRIFMLSGYTKGQSCTSSELPLTLAFQCCGDGQSHYNT